MSLFNISNAIFYTLLLYVITIPLGLFVWLMKAISTVTLKRKLEEDITRSDKTMLIISSIVFTVVAIPLSLFFIWILCIIFI